ncbi:MAG TPA: LysM peptidoglycan-binding domain-containing protein [Patescibacteria group bacterium]|nr:LysM peptidoglycan-binding domain-containing protein [Patescibacteria group bacterium]
MPRKKTVKSANKNTTKKVTAAQRVRKTQADPKSYISLLYGVLSVLILFIIIFLGLKALSERPNPQISDQAANTEAKITYTVKEGDSLWTIAEKELKDGYQWKRIADVNQIVNPNVIEKGTVLTIPENQATPTPAQVTPTEAPSTPSENKITGKTYIVQKGDCLWTIAERAYGDPYKWTEIAKANNLTNPDLIFSGNRFILPR